MLAQDEAELKSNLYRLLGQDSFRDSFTVVFGSNEPAERIADILGDSGVKVDAFIDNNQKKWGCHYNGIPVCPPEEAVGGFRENARILIASKYYEEMKKQLEKMGYREGRHIFQAINLSPASHFSVSEKTFDEQKKYVLEGKRVYEEIRGQYEEAVKLFVCPYQALGDVYMAGRYLQAYCQKEQISKYVLAVVGNACWQVAGLFKIQETVTLTQEESRYLVQFLIFAGLKECNAKILHHRLPHTAGIGVLGNYRGIHFEDHFRYSIFGVGSQAIPAIPEAHSSQAVAAFFEKNKLKQGKTVIVAPYANTAAKLPAEYWQGLINPYIQKGYTACTNSSGEQEPTIPGTKKVFFPIADAIPIVERAGVFIGLRSGLCDVISTAKAKKIIVYPDRVYQSGSFLEYYSLNRMGLCSDAEEIIADV